MLFFFTKFDQMSRIGSLDLEIATHDGDLKTFGNIFDSKRALWISGIISCWTI